MLTIKQAAALMDARCELRMLGAQRDALLAACRSALEVLPRESSAPPQTKVRACEIADQVRAAIAMCEAND